MNNICRPSLLSVFWVLTSFNLCNLYTGHASIPMYCKCINLFFNYIVPLEKPSLFIWCTKRLAPKNIPKKIHSRLLGSTSPDFPGVNLPRDPRPAKVMLEEAEAGGEFQTSEKVKGEGRKRPKRMDVLVVLRVNGLVITPKVGYITPKVG